MTATVSVILPAYNERDNVLLLIDEIHIQLKGISHQIIVIDDQSTDGTFTALSKLHDERVFVMQTPQRFGLGRSIGAGIDHATGDLIVVMDSDFNHQPRYLPFMVRAMDVYDCAFASRFYPGGGMTNLWRQLLSRSFNVFIQWMLRSPVKDHLYGFFIVRRNVLGCVPFADVFWGYGDYCMRLIYFLQGQTNRVLEFPAINGERRYGQGNPHLWRTFVQYAKAVIIFSQKIRMQ